MIKLTLLITTLLAGSAALAAQTPATPAEPVQPAAPVQPAEPTQATEPATAEEPAEPAPAPGEVARAQFTTAIQNREPVDQVSSVASDIGTIYFFTDLRDFEDQTVTHRWSYNGDVVAEVAFNVGGRRWRVWSSKNLLTDWIGDWTVDVVAADGSVVESQTLTVTAPVADPMPVEEPAAPAENSAPDNQGKE